MSQVVQYLVPGTKIEFKYGNDKKRGTVLEYFPEYKIYKIISDDVFYYITQNDVYLHQVDVNNDPILPRGTAVKFKSRERQRSGRVIYYSHTANRYKIMSNNRHFFAKPEELTVCPVDEPRLPNNTVVEFEFADRIMKGVVVNYYPAFDKYRVACELGRHYAKREDLIVCHTETENQDNSPMTQNHQQHPSPGEKMPAENTTNNEEQLKLLELALNGSRGKQQRIIAEEGLALVELLLRKNHDYGSSVFKPPVLAPELSELSAIDVRMSDKIARINNLKTCASEIKSESIDETYKDLAGYIILRRSVQRYLLETDPSRSGT